MKEDVYQGVNNVSLANPEAPKDFLSLQRLNPHLAGDLFPLGSFLYDVIFLLPFVFIFKFYFLMKRKSFSGSEQESERGRGRGEINQEIEKVDGLVR